MESKSEKPKYTEAELRRLLALDRAKVEESLAKNKTVGRKIGAVIALAVVMAIAIAIFVIITVDSQK